MKLEMWNRQMSWKTLRKTAEALGIALKNASGQL
jgi:hypothetical protein